MPCLGLGSVLGTEEDRSGKFLCWGSAPEGDENSVDFFVGRAEVPAAGALRCPPPHWKMPEDGIEP